MGARCPQIKICFNCPNVAQKEDKAQNGPEARVGQVTRLFPSKTGSTGLPVLIDVFHRLNPLDLCMH